jgi:hypothetical protein
VGLEKHQHAWLKREGQAQERSMSYIIRSLIDRAERTQAELAPQTDRGAKG